MSHKNEPTQDSCSCLTDVPIDLLTRLNKDKQFNGVITKVRFKDMGWSTVNWQVKQRLSTRLELDMTTRKTPKQIPLYFKFCPFCGVEYN